MVAQPGTVPLPKYLSYNALKPTKKLKKANISADQQAVNSMNKYLKIEEVENGKPTSVDKVVEVLIENDYQSDLTTYYNKYSLAWLAEKNMVVLVEDNKVVYPVEYVDETNYQIINPMVKDVEDLLTSIKDGETVFVAEDIIAEAVTDLHFNTAGNYGLNLNGNTIFTNVPNTVKGYKDGLVVNENANVVISNGTIEGGNEVSVVHNSAF